MANKEINELVGKSALVAADMLPVYDSAEAGDEKLKKITIAEFNAKISAPPTMYMDDAVDLGNADFPTSYIQLRGANQVLNITNWYPVLGTLYVLTCHDSYRESIVSLGGSKTFDGVNNKATFDSENQTLVLFASESGQQTIIANVGNVDLGVL